MHVETEDPLSDAALIRAARKRLLSEFEASPHHSAQSVINNYGGSGGLMDHLGGGAGGGEDPFDYFVDIARKDAEINPDTGKPSGWTKSVHRHRGEKKK